MPNAPAGWYPDPLSGKLRYFDGEKWLDIPAPPGSSRENQSSSDINTRDLQNMNIPIESQKSKTKRKSKRLCLCPNPKYSDGKCVYCGDFVGEGLSEVSKHAGSKTTPFIRDGTCVCSSPQFSEGDICSRCRRKIESENRGSANVLDEIKDQKYGLIGNYVICSNCGELNKNSTWCLKCHRTFEMSHNEVSPAVESQAFPHKGKAKWRRNWVLAALLLMILIFFIGVNSEDNSIDSASRATNESGNVERILTRLNQASNVKWSEDPAFDWTGSRSLAVYLESSGDNCAVWVFSSEAMARTSLDSGTLDFPGQEIYVGRDTFSNLGVIALSPYSGANCEFDIAEALGWGN